jgi:hypothetical protein
MPSLTIEFAEGKLRPCAAPPRTASQWRALGVKI